MECAARVCEETEAACAEAEAECATYRAALVRLAAEDARPLPPEVRRASDLVTRDMAQALIRRRLRETGARLKETGTFF